MKKLLLAALLAASVTVSCTPSRERRISRDAAYFQTLPASDRALVEAGKIRLGMPENAVYLALGKPDRVSERMLQNGKAQTLWIYLGYRPVFTQSPWAGMPVLDRYGRTRYYFAAEPDITYLPYEQSKIVFANGCVIGWDQNQPKR